MNLLFPIVGAATLFILLAWTVFGVAWRKHRRAVEHDARGLDLYELGRYEDAQVEFHAAIRLDETFAPFWYHLGSACQRIPGQTAATIRAFEQAMAIDPDLGRASYGLGYALLHGRNDIDGALIALRRAVESEEETPELHNTLGIASLRKTLWKEARESFDRAILLRPDYAEAHANLGIAFVNLGLLDDARAAFLKAAQLDPRDADARNNLGNLYGLRGQNPEALREFETALAIDPENGHAWYWTGCLYRTLGRKEAAIAAFERSIDLLRPFAVGHYNLALCFEEMNRKDEAKRHMDVALTHDPQLAEGLI